jgi:hypothetical protein
MSIRTPKPPNIVAMMLFVFNEMTMAAIAATSLSLIKSEESYSNRILGKIMAGRIETTRKLRPSLMFSDR